MPGARFPSTEALKRLGIVEPTVFFPSGGALQPTIQVADLSRSIATEPVEARIWYAADIPPGAPGTRGTFELLCRSAGGLIVEYLRNLLPGDGENAPLDATLGAGVVIAPGEFLSGHSRTSQLDVGGIEGRGLTRNGFTASISALHRWYNSVSPTPVYVRAGEVFRMQSLSTTGARFSMAILWRELTDIQP